MVFVVASGRVVVIFALAFSCACSESHPRSDASSESTQIAGVTIGPRHRCAWTEDGRAYCWGDNTSGQLGDGTLTRRPEPVPVSGLEGVVEMVATGTRTCALDAHGEVQCLGNLGSLGRTVFSPEPIPGLGDVVGMRAVGAGICAWQRDGTLRCWDTLEVTTPEQPEAFRDLDVIDVRLTGTRSHFVSEETYCAHTRDLEVHCGGIWDGREDSAVTRYFTDVVDLVALGLSFGCVTRAGSELVCWQGDIAYDPIEPRVVDGFGEGSVFVGGEVRACGLEEAGGVRCLDESLELREISALAPARGIAVDLNNGTTCAWSEGVVVICEDHDAGEVSELRLPVAEE